MESDDYIHDFRDSELDLGAAPALPRHSPPVVAKRPPHFRDGNTIHAEAEVLKVSTRSRPSAVAGAIAGVIRESGTAEVQSIGAGATNQAIKAVAIARSYLQEEGIDIVCIPAFIDVAIDEEERTAIRLVVQKRSV